MNPEAYNAREHAAGRITEQHLAELVRRYPGNRTFRQRVELFQFDQGLGVDGMAGPKTRALLDLLRNRTPGAVTQPPATSQRPRLVELTVRKGWLVGAGVEAMPIHASWCYTRLSTLDGNPAAIVAHYTATAHGTARAMARNRAKPITKADRSASWHVSIEGDGTIVQMASLEVGCWHAGGKTALPIPGVGPANRTSVGIELVGDGSAFPDAQVTAAKRVWCAIARAYKIPRELAMVQHSELDPTRKRDPGPVWMNEHAQAVLDYTYSERV